MSPPLKDQIDRAFAGILATTAGGGGRRLYVYFGGHGLSGGADATLLCLASWSLALRGAALSEADYRVKLAESGCFSEIVFLVDACRTRVPGAFGQVPIFGGAAPKPASLSFVAQATRDQFPAFEAASAAERKVRGHFTRALLAGLRGGAVDENHAGPGVTADGLKRYIEIHTPRIAGEHGHVQRAQVNNGLSAAPPAIFGAAPADGLVEIDVPPGFVGTLIVEGVDGEVLRSAAPPAVWQIRLPRGTYFVTDAAGAIKGRFRIKDSTGVLHAQLQP